MPIRVTGMVSGLDTESIISALVSSYSTKKDKVVKAQTKHSWTQEAWKNINTKVYGLYTDMSSLRFTSAYNVRSTSISDATKAKVTASNDAVLGTQSLEIKSLAKSAYLTGGKINATDGKQTLHELGFVGEQAKISVKIGEETKDITLTEDTTINDYIGKLKEAGLNASFDSKNQRIFVSAKESGAASNFDIVAKNDDGSSALAFLGMSTGAPADSKYAQIAALGKYKEVDGVKVYDGNATRSEVTKILEKLKADADKKKEYKAKLDEFDQRIKDVTGDTDEEIATKKAEIAAEKDKYIEDNAEMLAGIEQYATDNSHFVQDDYDDINIASLSSQYALEIGNANAIATGETALGGKAVKIEGTDAKIILNNAEFVSNSNSFSINGLNIEATGLTKEGEPITISTSVDAQGIYDKLKDFLGKYNDVINEITKLYNAESSKGYEPLTDEEKDAMSDTEVEKWESKIKGALLRRDTTLGGVMSAMINAMNKTYDVNGKTLSLTSFGIHTLGFLNAEKNEQNAFHINGDQEDKSTSGLRDQLMEAINEDPESVTEFMKQLVSGLYNDLGEKMKSTALSSVYTIYNDKEMASEYSSYNTTIKEWEKKLTDMEDKYYKKFAAMESSLSKLQSSTTSLTGLMG